MLGLDVPVYVQYGRWLGDIFLYGTLGESLYGSWAVEEKIIGRLPVTLELGFLAIAIEPNTRNALAVSAMPALSLLSDANLRFVGDPGPSRERFSTEQRNNAFQDRERRPPALVPESQHHDAVVLGWWICANVGEVQIQGNECTSFTSADANDFLVTSSA